MMARRFDWFRWVIVLVLLYALTRYVAWPIYDTITGGPRPFRCYVEDLAWRRTC